MKLHLVKNNFSTMEYYYPYRIGRMDLEGQELAERLRDYLTRFVAGTLDPDLQGVSPDKFISNLMNGRFGAFADRYIITADANGSAAGILIGMPDGNNGLHIYSVHVLPEYRGKGVASAMLVKCSNDMYEKNIDKLFIDVHTDNLPAMNLYKKFGFKTEEC